MSGHDGFLIRIFIIGEEHPYTSRHWPQVPSVGDEIYCHEGNKDQLQPTKVLIVKRVMWGTARDQKFHQPLHVALDCTIKAKS